MWKVYNKDMKVWLGEFVQFLKEYKVIALAVAFVMGAASTDLVKSLVNDVFMPLVAPLLPEGAWQTATLALGPVNIAYGSFLAELLNFVILALVVFLVARKILKTDAPAK